MTKIELKPPPLLSSATGRFFRHFRLSASLSEKVNEITRRLLANRSHRERYVYTRVVSRNAFVTFLAIIKSVSDYVLKIEI